MQLFLFQTPWNVKRSQSCLVQELVVLDRPNWEPGALATSFFLPCQNVTPKSPLSGLSGLPGVDYISAGFRKV